MLTAPTWADTMDTVNHTPSGCLVSINSGLNLATSHISGLNARAHLHMYCRFVDALQSLPRCDHVNFSTSNFARFHPPRALSLPAPAPAASVSSPLRLRFPYLGVEWSCGSRDALPCPSLPVKHYLTWISKSSLTPCSYLALESCLLDCDFPPAVAMDFAVPSLVGTSDASSCDDSTGLLTPDSSPLFRPSHPKESFESRLAHAFEEPKWRKLDPALSRAESPPIPSFADLFAPVPSDVRKICVIGAGYVGMFVNKGASEM